ncbi:MAG: autotransporter assembly complex family protein [Rhodospirillales bacterium]
MSLGFAAPAHADIIDSVLGFFGIGDDKKEEPIVDAVPYTIDLTVTGANGDVRSAIKDASTLISLKKTPPSGSAGLARRATADLDRITAALYGQGYYAGKITITVAGKVSGQENVIDTVEQARAAGPIPVSIAVETGPQFKFGVIKLLEDKTKQPLSGALPSANDLDLAAGQPAEATKIDPAGAVVLDALRERGYPFAKVVRKDVVADHADNTINVTFWFDTGPQASFGRVAVNGAKDVDESFITDRIDIKPGEPYSPAKLALLRKNLSSYSAFSSVRVREAEQLDVNGQLPVTVEVEERKPRFIGIAAKYSMSEGSSVDLYWGHRNLFGGAETLRIDLIGTWYVGRNDDAVKTANPFGYKLSATFAKPGIITIDDDLLVQIAAFREVTNAYVREAVTVLPGIRHRFNEHLSVQGAIDFEIGHGKDTEGPRKDTIVGVPFDLIFDNTDSPLDPSRGFRIAGTIEPFAYLGQAGAGPFLLKGSISAYRALDTEKNFVVAGRIVAGSIFGTSLFNVPPQRRFFVGGGGTLRGYDFQAASPRNANNDIIGGLSFVSASAELRFKVTDTIGLVPFVDAGSAYRGNMPTLSGLRYGAGLGLRYYTGIGPIRFDVAVPLNRQRGDSRYGLYISIGQAF